MIFAIVRDVDATGRTLHAYLTEFRNANAMEEFAERRPKTRTVTRTHWTRAHAWVRNGQPHDTALWILDGRVRRAHG